MSCRHFLLFFAVLIFAAAVPASALAEMQVEPSVEYVFGKEIAFRARVDSDVPIQRAVLFLKSEGDAEPLARPATIRPEGKGVYELSTLHDLTAQPLRAFSEMSYWYEIEQEDGQSYTSPKFPFYYEDNRFDWQNLEQTPFQLHWHQGDGEFASSILEVAAAGLKRVQDLLALPAPENVDIYIYADAAEMQPALAVPPQNWVAGHADPGIKVMMVALPVSPEQQLLMEQRIPHELMHIMLFQATKPAYWNLPTWLNEGLASIAELYPNPDYQILLDNDRQKHSLLPIASLCHSFPRETSGALLAYAEAASFTRYLHNQFGAAGLQILITSYANGSQCEAAIENSLGLSLKDLESQWRKDTFGENLTLTAFNNFLPWLILLLTVLAAPLGFALTRLRSSA